MQSKAAEENIDIYIDAPIDLPELEADPDKMKQVILNLLSNAIKYNQPKGKVTLTARVKDTEMCLKIQDTGFGIPEDSLQHLFKKFYRVRETEDKAVGTGLGLSITKQIVQGHRGSIEVKSKFGEGTSFIIRLPLKAVRD